MKRSTLVLSILLVASLCANLAIVGMFAGHWLRGRDTPKMADDRLMNVLPDEVRPGIHQAMKSRNPAAREQIDALRAARRAVGDAFRARPFDAQAATDALAALRGETTRGQELLHKTIVEQMAAAQANGTLPPPAPPRRGPDRPEGGPPPEAEMEGPPPPPPPPAN